MVRRRLQSGTCPIPVAILQIQDMFTRRLLGLLQIGGGNGLEYHQSVMASLSILDLYGKAAHVG